MREHPVTGFVITTISLYKCTVADVLQTDIALEVVGWYTALPNICMIPRQE